MNTNTAVAFFFSSIIAFQMMHMVLMFPNQYHHVFQLSSYATAAIKKCSIRRPAALYVRCLATAGSSTTAAVAFASEQYTHGAIAAPVSFAPMMDYTDVHQRYFQRLITKRTTLYTEMVTSNALTRTDNQLKLLDADFSMEEPLVLQLGGSDTESMKGAAIIAKNFGYKEINLNCGCPSPKVAGAGCFGVTLMRSPHTVADICRTVYEVMGVPTTVKCRIGVDDQDSYEALRDFVRIVSTEGNVFHFVIHARKAILDKNFSAADNRKIPPLKYDVVYALVRDFPHLHFTLNGGVSTVEEIAAHMQQGGVHGVMLGRASIHTPYDYRKVDSTFYNAEDPGLTRRQILERYGEYACEREAREGPRIRNLLMKPALNLFRGERNGRPYRRRLDEMLRGVVGVVPVLENNVNGRVAPSSSGGDRDEEEKGEEDEGKGDVKVSSSKSSSRAGSSFRPVCASGASGYVGEMLIKAAEECIDSEVLDMY